MRALVVGVGLFTREQCAANPRRTGEELPRTGARLEPLPPVVPTARRLAETIAGIENTTLLDGAVLCNPDRAGLERAWHRLMDTASPDEPLLLHFAGHGLTKESKTTLYLATRDTDSLALPATAVQIGEWLSQVEDTGDDRQVLFLLDVCRSGRAVSQQVAQLIRGDRRKAWVIAACGENESAFAAAFTRATSTVLDRLRQGLLDLAPTLAHVSVAVMADEIARELAHHSERHGLPQQTVMCTTMPEAGGEHPLFFPNPRYRPTPVGRLLSHLDLGLRAFINELDAGLDPLYFIGRASGDQFGENPLGRCFFSGREAQLSLIKQWLAERDTARPLTLVTGSPGSGKSALLGMLVCLAHPQLQPVRGTFASTVRQDLRIDVHPRLVAVHVRQRNPQEVLNSIAAQLGLSAPERFTWDVRTLIGQLEATPGETVVVIDALDEAVRPQELVDTVLLPLARARTWTGEIVGGQQQRIPVCKLIVGTRPWWDWFGALRAECRRQGQEIDLDTVTATALRADLTRYAGDLLEESALYSGAGQAELRRAVADAVGAKLSSTPEIGAFLLTSVFCHYLAERDTPVSGEEAHRLLPTTLPGILELHLRTLQLNRPWLPSVLTAVAQARGDGLPQELVHAISLRADGSDGTVPSRSHSLADTAEALAAVRFYLRESTENDGRRLYRFFHQSLNDYLTSGRTGATPISQPGGIQESPDTPPMTTGLEALLAAAPRPKPHATEAHCAWDLALPYLRRHGIEHADAAQRVDELLGDLEFLVHADPMTLLPYLPEAVASEAVLHAQIYRTSIDVHGPATPAERRQVLALDAHRWKSPEIARRLLNNDDPRDAGVPTPRWSTGTRLLPHISRGTEGELLLSQVDGSPVGITPTTHGAFHVWNLDTGHLRNGLHGHRKPAPARVVGPVRGRALLVTGSYDHSVHVWDLGRPELVHEFLGHLSPVTSVDLARVGERWLALASGEDGTVYAWDLDDGTPRYRWAGSGDSVNHLATGHVGRTPVLAAVTGQRVVHVWSLLDGSELWRLSNPSVGRVLSLAIGQDDEDAVLFARTESPRSKQAEKTVSWRLSGRSPRANREDRGDPSILLSINGHVLEVPKYGTTQVVDLSDRTSVAAEYTDSAEPLHTTGFLGSQHVIASRSRHVTQIWSATTGSVLRTFGGNGGRVQGVALCRSGGRRTVVSLAADGHLRLWEDDGRLTRVLPPPKEEPRGWSLLAGQGEILHLGAGNISYEWNLLVDASPRQITKGSTPVTALAGERHISAHLDRTITLGDPYIREHRQLTNPAETANAVAGFKGGLVTGSAASGAIRSWNLGELGWRDMGRHPGLRQMEIASVRGQSDDALLVTAGTDAVVQLWELHSGALKGSLQADHGVWTCFAIQATAHGPAIVTGGSDGRLRFWSAVTQREWCGPYRLPHPIHAVRAAQGRIAVGYGDEVAVFDWPSLGDG
ncbi:AAA family ATPase [Streptomyces phaeochromogenes]|uniref:AAA family ATPase n=1 Tax=Streptomyces phaeochromogenes TaxID=1923 RepID=UPI002E296F87|nr:AAA family ATPase [Streptomyces phaeochromogenes]